jgi:alanine racemase
VAELPSAYHSSWIELSGSALRSNLRFLRRLVGRRTEIASVVKGNAYGHGIEAFVPLAERCGVRRFATFSASEALRVAACRQRHSEIMIMGDLPDEAVPWAVEEGVSFYIFDLPRLDRAIRAARRIGRPARVHLELETGLNRTGLAGRTLERVVERVLGAGDAVLVEGVCTHYAGAESIGNQVRIERQIADFKVKVEQLEARGSGRAPGTPPARPPRSAIRRPAWTWCGSGSPTTASGRPPKPGCATWPSTGRGGGRTRCAAS